MRPANDARRHGNKVCLIDRVTVFSLSCGLLTLATFVWHPAGEFIPVEEPKEDKNKKRTVQEDGDGDGSDEDDDRIDMSAITGAKEREERREQFNAIQREGKLR